MYQQRTHTPHVLPQGLTTSQLQGMGGGAADKASDKASQTDLVSLPGPENAKALDVPVRPSQLAETHSQAAEASQLQMDFQAAQPWKRTQILRQEVSRVSP